MSNCRATWIALLCLTGCADVHWERAFYEGQRNASEQCRLTRRPADAPCVVLPDYSHYEKERARAAGGTAAPESARTTDVRQP